MDRRERAGRIINVASKSKGLFTVEDCQRFINNTKNVNLSRSEGATHLHMTAAIGNADAIKILLDNGHYLNVLDEYGLYPFDFAMIVGNIKNAEYLLSRGAKVKFKNKRLWKSHMIPALYERNYDLRYNGFIPRLSTFINKFNQINQALGSRS